MSQKIHPRAGPTQPAAPQWLLEPAADVLPCSRPSQCSPAQRPPFSLLVPEAGVLQAEGEISVFARTRLGRPRPAGFCRARAVAFEGVLEGGPCGVLLDVVSLPRSGPWSSGGCPKNPLAPL